MTLRPRVIDLGQDRKLLDIDFRDTEGLVAAYLLPQEEGWTLIETGPSSCRAALLDGVRRAGVSPGEIRRVFVTHIHLDHAGGVGSLADALPHATFYAHALGVPHLIDPTRLIASARRAWGAAADPLWGPIVPVPAPRIEALQGGERFALRGGELAVLATPGHAKHHLAFFDSGTRGIFTGDGAGVRLERSRRIRPAVPPPDLDLDLLFSSLEAMRRLDPALVLYSHFGPSPDGAADLGRYRTIVEEWSDVALAAAREKADSGYVAEKLRAHDQAGAPAAVPGAGSDRTGLVSGYELAAQGFLRFFETRGVLHEGRG